MYNKTCRISVILLVILLSCLSRVAMAQDTIYEIETIIVYDTVFVYDTMKIPDNTPITHFEQLQPIIVSSLIVDTISQEASLLLISGNKSATIPLSSIILDRNIKNINDMKKLSFFSLVMFAFNAMVLAQSDYGVSVGGGTWWSSSSESISQKSLSPTMELGGYFKTTLFNKLSFKTGLNYHFLSKNDSYSISDSSLNWHFAEIIVPMYYPEDTLQEEVFHYRQSCLDCVDQENIDSKKRAVTNYHQFSIPIQVGYTFGHFTPYIGIECSYRFGNSEMNEKIWSYGITGSLDYSISNRLCIGVDYYYGISKDVSDLAYEWSNGYEPLHLDEKEYSWKSRRLEISLSYNLSRNKNVEGTSVE